MEQEEENIIVRHELTEGTSKNTSQSITVDVAVRIDD